jgi:hypothetical protein
MPNSVVARDGSTANRPPAGALAVAPHAVAQRRPVSPPATGDAKAGSCPGFGLIRLSYSPFEYVNSCLGVLRAKLLMEHFQVAIGACWKGNESIHS